MTHRILDRDPRVGKRWPYRVLDFLPSRQLWRFLAWRSRGQAPDAPFDLHKDLTECNRLLLVLPEDLQELLISIPVVQAHFQALPKAAIWLVSGPRESPFLAGIFGRERILTLDPNHFFLGEGHFRELQGRLHGMRPDLVLNFRTQSPPLLLFLLRGSQARLRIQLGFEARPLYSNITLCAANPPNYLGHFQMAARLWDSAGIPVAGKWGRLVPSADSQPKAEAMLAPLGLRPASTVLVPWQARPEAAQTALVKAVAERAGRDGKSVAVLHSRDSLFGTPPPPAQVAGLFPAVEADSPGALLALFSTTAGTEGMNGPLLQLAGLTDTDVTGYFTDEDAPYDTSSLNPRLRVLPLDRANLNL